MFRCGVRFITLLRNKIVIISQISCHSQRPSNLQPAWRLEKKVSIPEKTSIENLIRSGFAKQAAQLDLLGIDGAANNLCVGN